jgi:hypothetical protein
MALPVGAQLGPYEILSLVGAGGHQSPDRKNAISADGQRFLINVASGEASTAPITVVVNWAAGIKK